MTASAGPRLDLAKLAAARLLASDKQPFLSVALFAMSPVEEARTGTFGVDERWRLHVDPTALERWSVPEVAAVLLHEVGHLVRDHAARARATGVTPEQRLIWNIAADAEINDDLSSDGLELPAGVVDPARLGEPPNRSAEYYFHRLLERHPAEVEAMLGTGLRADCGAGAHGVAAEPRVLPPTWPIGLGELDADLVRRQVAEAILAWSGNDPGRQGGGWARWADALLAPQLDWRRLLRGAIRSSLGLAAGTCDYSYGRPARRRIEGIVMPSLVRPLPVVAVVIDTSASVSDRMLGAAWAEVQGCLRQVGVRRDLLAVYSTDVVARRVATTRGRHIALPGGGGTDMRVGIRAAEQARPRPSVIVVLTDGLTPWPTERGRAALVIGLLGSAPTTRCPPWGRTIRIEDDGRADRQGSLSEPHPHGSIA